MQEDPMDPKPEPMDLKPDASDLKPEPAEEAHSADDGKLAKKNGRIACLMS